MKRSIFARTFGSYLLITALLTALIILISVLLIKNYYISDTYTHMDRLAALFKDQVAQQVKEGKGAELDSWAKKAGRQLDVRITVAAADGKVIADTDSNPAFMENHKTHYEIGQALEGKPTNSLRMSVTLGKKMAYTAVPLTYNGKVIGALRLSVFSEDINNLLSNLTLKIILIALIILAVSLVTAFIFSREISEPIYYMKNAARDIASGNFRTRIALKRKDELKDLADSFNYMAAEINKLFEELSAQKEELKSIIASIEEGLMVIDEKEKILLCNESFKKTMKYAEPEGKHSWEVIKSIQFNTIVDRAISQKTSVSGQVEIGNNIYECSAAFIANNSETVIMFHDITEMKRLEKIKKDFVANVSHELRTPLTSISGFIETLENEIGKKGRNYLEIIKKNTERLTNIVKDLLLLSEIEDKDELENAEEVDLPPVIENTAKIFENRAKEKNIYIKTEIENNLPRIKGDAFKLEQAFINLIDNAIKYTDSGGVTVSAKKDGNFIKLEVKDTGIGIGEEHRERIFERFYTVDKSRSRKLGGTGLGLAIVKHIVLQHSGTIEVDSKIGIGTKFTITLPTA